MKTTPSVEIKSGTQDEIEGGAKKLAGAIKSDAGKVLGSHGLEVRGEQEHAEGIVQKRTGEIKKSLGK